MEEERKSSTIDWVVNAVVKKVVYSYGDAVSIDDLKGEGYLVALERLDDWDSSKAKLSSFLYQVVWGRLSYLASSQKVFSPLSPNLEAVSGDTELETTVTLNQIEGKLSDKEKEIFKGLRAGYSHSEIADKLGISTRTIGRLLNVIKDHYSN